MRYPLIDWHGNNGNRDGNEPAASRYTECRLSRVGEEMLTDLKKNTVPWQNTYNDTEQEPIALPGRIPHLLVNGTSGIAWSTSCVFLPHNLGEVMDAAITLLKNADSTIDDLLLSIKGPDFPTAGMIINQNELRDVYLTGSGRVRVRGEYTIEEGKNETKIVFTSIPYQISKDNLIIKINDLCEKGELTGVTEILDESNYQGVRFVITVSKGTPIPATVAKLFKATDLESSYSMNQVAIVKGVPALLNLKQMLTHYIDHQKDVLLKRVRFDLNKVEERLDIVAGLLIAVEDIDEVIRLIKMSQTAEEAKTRLYDKYSLTPAQASAILNMTLKRLTKLDATNLVDEQKSLEQKQAEYKAILADPIPELCKIFTDMKEKYGDERRTTITQITATKQEKEIANVTPEKCVVTMTADGHIKRIPRASFRTQRRNGRGVKTAESAVVSTIRTNTVDTLMIFTNLGKMHRILVDKIPSGTNAAKGTSVSALVNLEPNEIPMLIYSLEYNSDAEFILFITKNGKIKKTRVEEYTSALKRGSTCAIKLTEDDSLVCVTLLTDEHVLIATKQGRILRLKSTECSPSGKNTMGVKGISLVDNDAIASIAVARDPSDTVALIRNNGTAKRMPLAEIVSQNRGTRGSMYYKCDANIQLVSILMVNDDDEILIAGTPNSICISGKDIPIMSRIAQGVAVISQSKVESATKI